MDKETEEIKKNQGYKIPEKEKTKTSLIKSIVNMNWKNLLIIVLGVCVVVGFLCTTNTSATGLWSGEGMSEFNGNIVQLNDKMDTLNNKMSDYCTLFDKKIDLLEKRVDILEKNKDSGG